MPQATRLGDSSTGHDACSPTELMTASENVFINGKGAGRKGDIYAIHGCDEHTSHNDSISEGSSTVFINGLPAGRVGDSVEMSGKVAKGSLDVFIGG